CLALAERHDLTMLVPRADDADRGRFLSALFFVTGEIEPVMKRYFFPHRYVAREEDAAAMRQRSLEWALDLLVLIEEQIQAGGPYQLGERYSLVDLILTYWIGNITPAEVLDRFPAVLRCDELVRQRLRLVPLIERNEVMRAAYAALQAKGEGVV
ncbi:MAG: glutathione S-transferase family protein, partial [Alphaproteobacteria bacterium]|nr:glutathione S-transferase family protein [Alphaproteobacteria bacterium]